MLTGKAFFSTNQKPFLCKINFCTKNITCFQIWFFNDSIIYLYLMVLYIKIKKIDSFFVMHHQKLTPVPFFLETLL